MLLIARLANGDARKSLGILESAAEAATDGRSIDIQLIKDIINKPNLLYDKKGRTL